ncbi:MAG: dihydrodipicolinate synthase family protein [Clostridia bacterium]|nr:dihydrodipicolinate synthase family protein [Clostridia bacterium]
MKEFHGLIVPILTPVDEKGSFDEPAFRALATDLVERGVDGLFVTGTTGEAAQLKYETWRDVNRCAIQMFGDSDSVHVYSGAVFPGTLEVIDRIHELEDMGAKYVFATPTFYYTDGSQDQVLRHYERICSAITAKLIVYSISFTTHVDIRTSTLARLAQFDPIVGVKDTRGDWGTHIENIRALKDTKVGIAVVPETMQAASLIMGADGIVTALGNFMPEYYVSMLEAARVQDWELVKERFNKVIDFDVMMRCPGGNGIAKLKYLASLLGIMQPYTSMSTMDVSEEARQVMQKTADFIRKERESQTE